MVRPLALLFSRNSGMFSLLLLSVSLSQISHALLAPKILDSDILSTEVLGPVSQLSIANYFIAPDGFNRSATLVNGVFPGPLIQANKNDTLIVQVFNELTDATMPLETSVHWHGIVQHESNWADGTAWVTQCPIRQQEAFEHRFNIANQSGTYWYHSHYSTQYCDGLRGSLVIYDPDDPLAYLYDVDDENTVITLADWWVLQYTNEVCVDPTQVSCVFDPTGQNICGGVSELYFNGLGRYAGGPLSPLSVINVQQGLRYRFRVISMSCNPIFNFSIDGHRMTIIEVDGVEVEPVEVDSIPIFAGQRYSVVVAANQPVDSYWIRSLSNLNPTFEGGQNMAILRYKGAPDEDPTSAPGPYELAFDEGNLHPLIDPGAPGVPEIGKADVSLQLAPGYNSDRYTFGNTSYVDPPVPVLLQILSGARHPSQFLPNGSVYELPRDKVIEVSFPNVTAAPGSPHPVHLHGHRFDVVRIAGSNKTNFVNPVRRDVVSMGSSVTDNVTIRFVTDNSGPWFLHCHVDWHLNHGFAVVMAEAPDEAAMHQAAVIPVDWGQVCLPYGA